MTDNPGHVCQNLSRLTFNLICYFAHGKGLTPAGKVTNKLVASFSLKMAERSEAKSAKRSFASKIKNSKYFDAKLRFALLASLRSAVFSEIQVDNLLVTFPARGL